MVRVSQKVSKGISFIITFLAEFFGAAMYVFLGCAGYEYKDIYPDQTSLAFGGAELIALEVFGTVSGGHFNPAISLALLVSLKMNIFYFIAYVLAQYLGAMMGYSIIFKTVLEINKNTNCILQPHNDFGILNCFLVEMLFTTFLVMAFCAAIDDRNGPLGKSFPFTFCFLVTGATFATIYITGAGLNPARAFAPHIFFKPPKEFFLIYQLAPYFGGLIGGLIYMLLFDSTNLKSLYSKLTPVQ